MHTAIPYKVIFVPCDVWAFLHSSYSFVEGCFTALPAIISLILVALLLTVHAFHIVLTFIFWVSFAHSLILIAATGTTVFLYILALFRENYAQLRMALGAVRENNGKMSPRGDYSDLERALKRNAFNFAFVFTFDGFISRQLLVYLGLHMPASAYFAIKLILGQNNKITQFIMLGLTCEAYIGSLLIHLLLALFSGSIHQSGKMLLRFSARQESARLHPRTRLLLSLHIHRLWVNHKYGITYGGTSGIQGVSKKMSPFLA